MRILGIDPGTTAVGYAILDVENRIPALRAADLVRIRSRDRSDRLKELHTGIQNLITTWHPDALAIERLFFTRNQKTALEVAEARGVILLTTALAGILTYEYTPLEVKKTVTGDGNADKAQMEKMIRLTMRDAASLNARDDVFDAIGIALTCFLLTRASLPV